MLRFAPSPIDDMNIGDLRIALLNYMVSKQKNEDLLIRLENTNENTKNKEKDLLEILNLFSIDYKFAVNQSDNIKYHSQFAMQLLIQKKAFNCFCGDEVLQKEKDEALKNNEIYKYSGFCENLSDAVTFECDAPFTVRLKNNENIIEFNDLIQGEQIIKQNQLDSIIILNHDKTPSYDFACAIDDMLSDVSFVIRDEKYIDNTANQIHIRNSISYNKEIKYAHIPSIENYKVTIKSLIDDGYLPVAIANYLVCLGFDTPKEIFTIEEALVWFDISKISKTPVKFDINRLKLINKEHIKDMDELRLSKLIGYSDQDIGYLAKLYLHKCDTIVQLKENIDKIFSNKTTLEGFENEFNILKKCIMNTPYIKDFNEFKNYISQKTSLKDDNLIIPLKYALTGAINTPKLSDIYPLIRNYIGEIIK